MGVQQLEQYNFDPAILERAREVEQKQKSFGTDFVGYLASHGIGIEYFKKTQDTATYDRVSEMTHAL